MSAFHAIMELELRALHPLSKLEAATHALIQQLAAHFPPFNLIIKLAERLSVPVREGV